MSNTRSFMSETGIFLLRVLTGAGMIYHGYGKIFDEGRMPKFAEYVGSLGFPAPELFAWMAALSEFAGGVLLMIGLFTRPASFLILCTMFVAAFVAHSGQSFKEIELPLAYAVVALSFILIGGGKFSLDNLFNLKIK